MVNIISRLIPLSYSRISRRPRTYHSRNPFQNSIILLFTINSEKLKKIIKIFYNKELNPGLFLEHEIINTIVSGTIGSAFFFSRVNSLEDVTQFLINLWIDLYFERNTEQVHLAKNFLTNFVASIADDIGGSTRSPAVLLDNLNNSRVNDNDFLRLEFHLFNVGPQREINYNQQILDDLVNNVTTQNLDNENFRNIINIRQTRDANTAHYQELFENRNDYSQLLEDFDNNVENLILYGTIRPQNLRQIPRVDYTPFLQRSYTRRIKRLNHRRRYTGLGINDFAKIRFINGHIQRVLTILRR